MKAIFLFLSLVFSLRFLQAQEPFLNWVKQSGGNATGYAIASDAAGNIYTTGNFKNTVDFDPGPAVHNLTAADYSIFISKLDANGNFKWAKAFSNGNIGSGYGKSVAIDLAGNIFITGSFSGTVDFNPGPGIHNLTTAFSNEIFLVKLNDDGDFASAKQLGRSHSGINGSGQGSSVAVDYLGNIYLSGIYYGSGDFDPGPAIFNLGIGSTGSFAFIVKLDASINLVWVRQTEGGAFSHDVAMKLDAITGNLYFTGGFTGTVDFDPAPTTYTMHNSNIGVTNSFILNLNVAGNFKWAKHLSGGEGCGTAITCDQSGSIYSTGRFTGTVDFDPGFGTAFFTAFSVSNMYVLRLSAAGDFNAIRKVGDDGTIETTGIALDAAQNVYVTGNFNGTVDFEPGYAVHNLVASGASDVFIAKMDIAGPLAWAVRMGGSGSARSNAILFNPLGSIYTTGSFNGSVDFDPGPADYQLISNGQEDMFVHKLKFCLNAPPVRLNISTCAPYLWNGQTLHNSGIYTQTFTNSNGCDSTVKLNLYVQGKDTVLNVTACNRYTLNGQTYNTSGTYTSTVTGSAGCDSLVTLQLQIVRKQPTVMNVTICAGEQYNGYSLSGVYTDTFSLNGCDSVRILTLAVEHACTPFGIPNIFTPNGDGLHEIFKPVIRQQVSGYHFVIFNRYGQKLFETRNPHLGWDGRFKSKEQPTGSYIYLVVFNSNAYGRKEEKGNFIMIR